MICRLSFSGELAYEVYSGAGHGAHVWEALIAVADAAGGEWPERATRSAVALVADSKAGTPSLGVRLLADLRLIFGKRESMASDDLVSS